MPRTSQTDPIVQMIYLMGHDLRASIRAVTELPDWLEEELVDRNVPLSETTHDYLRLLRQHGRRLDAMVCAFTKYAQITEITHSESRCPSEVLSDRIKEIGFADNWSIDLQVNVSDLPIAREDAVLLLSEILKNAKQHSDHAAPSLRVTADRVAEAVKITVSDTGSGIAAADRERILEPLVKLTTKDDATNVGMGLAIARKVVDKYAGTLQLDHAEAGRGLCVSVTLPA